ncbi:unnamed protein product [Nyctereutes procyonoides]|uniref:small monomeric GTPase n=1 Tax=Nyctereutes procyonoides TaxID=34880 RepID=A0A811Y697_NYCPR|nr:unnamed protein product [Nyctereutes procyonoides]
MWQPAWRWTPAWGTPMAGAASCPAGPRRAGALLGTLHRDRVPVSCQSGHPGGCGAGKSSLTMKLLTRRFISEYDPNLEDTYSSEETVDHQPVHPRELCGCLNRAQAFQVVYSMDSRQRFEDSSNYLHLLALHAKETQRSSPVTKAEGTALAGKFGGLFFEVSACLDFEHVQHVFHKVVREAWQELENSLPRTPFICEKRALPHQAPLTTRMVWPAVASTSTISLKEMPALAQAKLVTVKSSRAQSKCKAPTLTLLKGFKIF